MRTRRMKALALGALLAGAVAAPAAAKIPEPSFTIYGTAVLDGVPAERGTVTLLLPGETTPAAICRLGSVPDAQGEYVLRVPMDSLLPRLSGHAQPDDVVEVYLNGLWAGRVSVGAPGTFLEMPLEASTVHRVVFRSGPAGTPNPAPSGATVAVAVDARDSAGHALTHAWSALCPGLPNAGSFADASKAATLWTAPQNLTGDRQACTLGVAVSDGRGLAETRSYSQVVEPLAHALQLVSAPAGTPNPVDSGGTVALAATALDSFGHALGYSWSASCAGGGPSGSFAQPEPGTFTWTAPANLSAVPVVCTLTVAAADGRGATARWSFDETVRPQPHEVKFVRAASGTPSPVNPGGTVTVSAAVSDSLGHQLRYAWSASCPGFEGKGSFADATALTTRWTAPARKGGGTGECALTVRASDAVGASAASSYQQVVTDGAPVAVAAVDPPEADCPAEFSFDGDASHHPDPARRIVAWEWDFDYDGTRFDVEARGRAVRHAYGEAGVKTAALRVTDDGAMRRRSIATVEVKVDAAPAAADAGGPYEIGYGSTLGLSGAGSAEPGAACGNRITAYAWDFDGDGVFTDASGPSPRIGWERVAASVCGGRCDVGSTHNVALRVTDALGRASEATAEVRVVDLQGTFVLTTPAAGDTLGAGRTAKFSFVASSAVDGLAVSLRDGSSGAEVPLGDLGPLVQVDGPFAGGYRTWLVPALPVRTAHALRVRAVGTAAGAEVGADETEGTVTIGPMDLTAPELGAVVAGGSTTRITWRRFGTVRPAVLARASYSFDGGRSWQPAGRLPAAGNSFVWRVPQLRRPASRCKVAVDLLDRAGAVVARDVSEGFFTILGLVDVAAPEGGDLLYGGSSRTVRWTTATGVPAVAHARVEYSLDEGKSWWPVGIVSGNPGAISWDAPAVSSRVRGKIRVWLLDAGGRTIAQDTGDGFFEVLPKP